ncbi:MAG: DUF1684 domain-containing protein [Bacteroidota bacterium]
MNNRTNSSYIFIGIGIVFILIILISQLSNRPTAYTMKLEKSRTQKNLQFKNDPESPIPQEVKADFEALLYFPVDETYKVEAELQEKNATDTIRLMTTTGEDREMVEAGKLDFVLQGQKQRLTVFRYLDGPQDELFVPFRDLTTGISTYGGGRYIDMPMSQPLVLDLNLAYNTYCVYNAKFSCPIPPLENSIQLEIRAGELDWKE